jgi:sigma54-dependent transcription regulator
MPQSYSEISLLLRDGWNLLLEQAVNEGKRKGLSASGAQMILQVAKSGGVAGVRAVSSEQQRLLQNFVQSNSQALTVLSAMIASTITSGSPIRKHNP